MSNYNEIRALEAMLFSEASAGFTDDLSALADGLVMHYGFNLTSEQIDWIVNGILAEIEELANEAWLDLLYPEVTIH